MWLHWVSETGQAKRHASDFFVRRADGTGMLVDVRPDDRISDADSAVFAVMAGQTGDCDAHCVRDLVFQFVVDAPADAAGRLWCPARGIFPALIRAGM
jgi:hypothetical protein